MSDEKILEPNVEIVFEGGKGNLPPKISSRRREVGEGDEPIISEEVFNNVQQTMQNRRRLNDNET